MKYMQCSGNERAPALCSDDTCPCGSPGASIPRGEGYMYISSDVVDFRKDCLTEAEVQSKLRQLASQADATMVVVDPASVQPILLCEAGARKRGLDLAVAASDARHWWETGQVPLRPTPLAKQKRTETDYTDKRQGSQSAGTFTLPEAAREGDDKQLKQLLEQGFWSRLRSSRCWSKTAYVNLQEESGRSPLVHAALGGQLEAARLLLDHGARVDLPDASGRTPLHHAVLQKQTAMVRLLIERGCKVDLLDREGTSPLESALTDDLAEIATLLVKAGANLNVVLLHSLEKLHSVGVGNTKTARKLIALGADPNLRDRIGAPVMLYALQYVDLELVQALIEAGVDVNGRVTNEVMEWWSYPIKLSTMAKSMKLSGQMLSTFAESLRKAIKEKIEAGLVVGDISFVGLAQKVADSGVEQMRPIVQCLLSAGASRN